MQSVQEQAPPAAEDRNEIVLSARDIKVAFGDQVVLDGLSLDIHRGEILGFVGAAGAGTWVGLGCVLNK